MEDKPGSRPYADIHIGVVMESSRKKEIESPLPTSPTHLVHFLVVIGLIGLVLLSGGKFLWVKGLFVGIIGLLLILRPPQSTLDPKLDWTVMILLVIASFAFIPAGYLDFLPSMFFGRSGWWKSISGSGVELPVTVSPQPLKSLEHLVLLVAGLSYLYLLINSRFRLDDRWRLLQCFVLLGGLLAGLVVVGNLSGTQYFDTDRAASFSFFDNRNQTSILLVTIGIVALGMTFFGATKHWIWAVLSGLAFLLCALAISMSLSRAGLLLFVLGCGVWIILRFTVLGGKGALRVVVPLVALSFSLMLITGQETLSRFSDWLGSEESMFDDFRWVVYRDTVSLIAEQPATGVGLGNFAAVFPHYRDQSLSPQPIIHPESDWMWIAAEMGAPGFSIMATLVFYLFWMAFPLGTDRLALVRMAALIAVSVFLLHTFFDVSGHQLGVVLIAIWLFRMAMPHLKNDYPCKFPTWSWQAAGGLLILAGGLWITADTTGLMLHSSIVKQEIPVRVAEALEVGKSETIADDIETGLIFLPMDWELYLQRGQARLYIENNTNGARQDFQRARAIEPVLVAPALYEGQVWLPRSTHYAYEAWADALTRQSENPGELHHRIILESTKNPRFARDLDRLSQITPEFRKNYLASLKKEDFLRALSEDLRRDPQLTGFTPEQRERIMKIWLERGDSGRLIRFLEENPDAAPNSWYYRANALARMGNYPAAIQLAQEYAPIPQIPAMESLMLRDIREQRALFASRTTDVVRGGILLQTQLNNQDTEGARWTIEQLLKLKNPPPYVYYWQGELSRLDNNYADAWSGWKQYLKEVVERKIELKTTQAEMFDGIKDTGDNPLLWELVEPFQRK
ncbi:O-antigen ligase family protein [Cerasicoccus arenae]|uniref:O-antigen ligase-related domain-containing protein n=1 Tax=Cerasicoccus arenae TaxID=424488 RepID=A0A8J3DIB8_9BACT|nr:O-antigen ligase family protein [Cerasicoccus arenae]MBK1858897.1 O-antigen ligase family protein [Cerasicoccus arenae]GHC05907.1 hypothetical protein GCM10007047_23610 [Cerasicoccus arenae]